MFDLKLTFLSCGSNYVKSHDNTTKNLTRVLIWAKDSFITQDSNEYFEGW